MPTTGISEDSVILRFTEKISSSEIERFAKEVANFGFTGWISDDSGLDGHNVISPGDPSIQDIQWSLSASLESISQGKQVAAEEVWTSHDSTPDSEMITSIDLTTSDIRSHGAVALLLQMSLPNVPIVGFGCAPQALPRDHAHFVRSLIFWRNRNGIARITPRLVHAGADGTLVYILGSWLVALNWNDEEISIDVGDTGTMWLMLGTPLDVQLQGSLLVLPAYSGAILANELAR